MAIQSVKKRLLCNFCKEKKKSDLAETHAGLGWTSSSQLDAPTPQIPALRQWTWNLGSTPRGWPCRAAGVSSGSADCAVSVAFDDHSSHGGSVEAALGVMVLSLGTVEVNPRRI